MPATDPFLYLDRSTLLGGWALTNKTTYLEVTPVNPGSYKYQFKCRYDGSELVIDMYDGATGLNTWRTGKEFLDWEGADSLNAANIVTQLVQALLCSYQFDASDLVNVLAPRPLSKL